MIFVPHVMMNSSDSEVLFSKEGDMPIEDLLAMYGVSSGANGSVDRTGGGPSQSISRDEDGERSNVSAESGDNEDSARSSSESEILENQDLTLDKEEIARDLLANNGPADDRETTINDLLHTVASSRTARLLRCKYHWKLFLWNTVKGTDFKHISNKEANPCHYFWHNWYSLDWLHERVYVSKMLKICWIIYACNCIFEAAPGLPLSTNVHPLHTITWKDARDPLRKCQGWCKLFVPHLLSQTQQLHYTVVATDKNTFSQTSWGTGTQDYTGHFSTPTHT